MDQAEAEAMLLAGLDAQNKGDIAAKEHFVQVLAQNIDDVFDVVQKALGSKQSGAIATLVMQSVGYPRNRSAIPDLVDIVRIGHHPGLQLAVDTLAEIPPDQVVPYVIAVLWDRGQTNDLWEEDAFGVCSLLLMLNNPISAKLCGPTLALLLDQAIFDDKQELLGSVLDIFQSIPSEDIAYVIPALLDLTKREIAQENLIKATALISYLVKGEHNIYANVM